MRAKFQWLEIVAALLRALVAALMCCVAGAGAEPGRVWPSTLGAAETRAEFEAMAGELPFLDLGAVLYDRTEVFYTAEDSRTVSTHFQVLFRATDGRHARADLLELLSHSNANVRTLAAVALFDLEDPTVLPALVQLCDDEARTFDGHPVLSKEWLRYAGIGPPQLTQTVGRVARSMVAFYLEPAGFYSRYETKKPDGFAEYWAARSNRAFCASWFQVQMQRASQGIFPARMSNQLAGVRRKIDALRPEDRAWMLLFLGEGLHGDALASEAERVEACKVLGRDKLLMLLQGRIASDDPDFHSRRNGNQLGGNWAHEQVVLFVLAHARQLFRPEDAVTFLALEDRHREPEKHGITDPHFTPWWAIAAANLKPNDASQILHAAMSRFEGEWYANQQADLHAALWRLCGEKEMATIVDWFFDFVPNHTAARGRLLSAVGREATAKPLLKRIVLDARLSNLDWSTLKQLVELANGWSAEPVMAYSELAKAWHPYGEGDFNRRKYEAEKEYPKETADLRAHLADWRTRLVASAPNWLDHYTPPKPQAAITYYGTGAIPIPRQQELRTPLFQTMELLPGWNSASGQTWKTFSAGSN